MPFKITGGRKNSKFFVSIDGIANHTNQGIKEAFRRVGTDLKKEFKKEVKTGKKTGRLYGSHRASAPGETPANLSGHYVKSISTRLGASQLVFGNSAKYASYLEKGTKRMKPRPGLRNTIKSREGNILKTLKIRLRESI